MSDRYLWDKSGPKDALAERLESELGAWHWRPGPRSLDQLPARSPARRWRRALPAGVAASLLAAAGAAAWLYPRFSAAPPVASYRFQALAGSPRVQGSDRDVAVLSAGQWVECDAQSRARLRIEDLGLVVVEPNTRLRVEAPDGATWENDARYLLYLERGTLRASVFAAPRVFQLGTPAGLAVDLGCIYSATVEDEGRTTLRVDSGMVAFEAARRRVVVPAGAYTVADPDRGPATPLWNDAPEELRAAVAALDRGGAPDPAALESLLTACRTKDSLTLWHLLSSGDPRIRPAVYDRLVELAPPPPGVTRDGCLAGEIAELNRWKEDFPWAW